MTGTQFVTEVKARLNRLDTSSYEDVRSEEILFFGTDALERLILEYDVLRGAQMVGKETILMYIKSFIRTEPEQLLTNNELILPDMLKLKDTEVYVEVDDEKAWVTTREKDSNNTSKRQYNPFDKSYPDMPSFRYKDGKIVFSTDNFKCTKIRYEYLDHVEPLELTTQLDMIFIHELEDKTVTLILENLESRRLQNQVAISKS